MGSLQLDKEGATQNRDISRLKVPSYWSGPRMNTASPTILRTRHKFGDYLSQPDLAKFELPKKMSRPWIVNNAFEQEKLKDLIVTERPVEASLVMRQIKESKQERKKQSGYNKKHVRNINDIIEKDQKTVQPLPEHVVQPQHVFHPHPSDSPFSSSSSSSSTCSSVSPPASDDGFVDGSDLESESGSLVELVDDIKLVDD